MILWMELLWWVLLLPPVSLTVGSSYTSFVASPSLWEPAPLEMSGNFPIDVARKDDKHRSAMLGILSCVDLFDGKYLSLPLRRS